MVLAAADLAFFAEHGWVVAKGVISREQAARTAQEVWDFAGLDPDDPDSWYAEEDGATPRPINALMYHGQAEWENRVAPRVHEAFAAIWGSERLWTSHDSVNLNLPSRDPEAAEHAMHWDCDLRLLSLAEAKAERASLAMAPLERKVMRLSQQLEMQQEEDGPRRPRPKRGLLSRLFGE